MTASSLEARARLGTGACHQTPQLVLQQWWLAEVTPSTWQRTNELSQHLKRNLLAWRVVFVE
jgi:hypothetical protein